MPALLSVTSTDTCVTSFFTKYRPDDPLTSHLPLHYDANLPHGTQFGPSSADAITEYAEKNDLLFTTKTDLLFAHLVLHGKKAIKDDGSGLKLASGLMPPPKKKQRRGGTSGAGAGGGGGPKPGLDDPLHVHLGHLLN